MWFIVMLFMAVISTLVWYIWENADEYKLDTLVLVSWGTTIMVFADHLMGYMEGSMFIDTSANALLLGIVLAITALLIWAVVLIIKDPKGKIWKKVRAEAS